MSHLGLCFCLKFMGLQGTPVLLSRMHLLETVHLLVYSFILWLIWANIRKKRWKFPDTLWACSRRIVTVWQRLPDGCKCMRRLFHKHQSGCHRVYEVKHWHTCVSVQCMYMHWLCVHYRVRTIISMSAFCQQAFQQQWQKLGMCVIIIYCYAFVS